MFIDQLNYKVEENKDKVIKNIEKGISNLVALSNKYSRRYELFRTGKTLEKNEGGAIKSQINFFRRFVKTHASYVVKDRPNIQCPAEHPDQFESKQLASLKERVLNYWWDSNKFVKKLKRAALRGAVFGDQYFFIYYDPAEKWIKIKVFDPLEIYYETIEEDPDSEKQWFIRLSMVDTNFLKKQYPKFKDKIEPTASSVGLSKIKNFTTSRLFSGEKSLVVYYIDKEYIYTVINGEHIVEQERHGYGFIPLIHWRYIDIGEKFGESLISVIEEPVKYVHLSLSYLLTNLNRYTNVPLVSDVEIPELDSKLEKGLLVVPDQRVSFLQVPQSPVDLYKVLEFGKIFMHFISGLSEEAMAGFTGALTAAGVAIELRLDATVREALDCQVVLQDVLQELNQYGLKLMESKLKHKNLLADIPGIGTIDHITEYTGMHINGNYYNIVDFGGILPRSDAQIVQNVLSKYKMGLISRDTALEELRYIDPSLERSKILKERIDDYKLQKALQEGQIEKVSGFDGPKDENYYMILNKTVVPVYPEQNHLEHYMEHKKAYEKTQDSVILLHMQMHQYFLEQNVGGPVSNEGMREQVKEKYQEPMNPEEEYMSGQTQEQIPLQ